MAEAAACAPLDPPALLRLLSEPCAGSQWQTTLAEKLPRSLVEDAGAPLAYINVGANKGYNIAEFLKTWTARHTSNIAWHAHIKRFAKEINSRLLKLYNCGVCGVCTNDKWGRDAHKRNASVAVHEALALDAGQ